MPLINQVGVIIHEGFHDGEAYDDKDKVSWAVPYKFKNWKFVRKDNLMKENLKWEDGKELIQSTTNVLMLTTPIKYDIPLPANTPIIIQKAVNYGAGSGTKVIIKKGVKYSLDKNEEEE